MSYTDSTLKIKNSIFQSIIDALPVLLFWCDKEHIVRGNNLLHAQHYKAKTSEEMVGMSLTDMGDLADLDDKLIAQWHLEHNEIMETGIGKIIEYQTLSSLSEEPKPYLCHKEPLRNEAGEVIGVTGISVEITELKKAQRQAEEASRAKSEFIANMSHDLRTPMHGVSGMQDLVLMAVDKVKATLDDKNASVEELRHIMSEFVENVEEYEKTAKSSTGQLIDFFNQILESVSLDVGGVEETPKVFNLFDLIERSVMLLQSAAVHKKLNLSYRIDERIPEYLHGLPRYLDRCIGNLLSNSLKFTNQGSVNIDVGLPDSSNDLLDKSFTLMITIRDTGIGIAEDKRKVIFNPFTRLTNSFDGVYKGSGLGLATVKKYIEKMHGIIRLDSEVGKGSTFTILVPVTVAESVEMQNSHKDKSNMKLNTNLPDPEQMDAQNSIAPIKSARKRLLVVEDNKPAAIFARVCLSSDTCLVDIAENGCEALGLIAKHNYNLIFMDIGLPDMTGIEVAKHIRQLANKQKSSVPIIALTGHASDKEKRQQCFDAGMNGVLGKPASESELKSIVEQCSHGDGLAINNPTEKGVDRNSSDELPIIDYPGCMQCANGNESLVYALLESSVETFEDKVVGLTEHYKNQDRDALSAELHHLLGGIGYLKLPRLEQAINQVRAAVKSTTMEPAAWDAAYGNLCTISKEFCELVRNKAFLPKEDTPPN